MKYDNRNFTREGGRCKERAKETRKETDYFCALLKETKEGSGAGDERAESEGVFRAAPTVALEFLRLNSQPPNQRLPPALPLSDLRDLRPSSNPRSMSSLALVLSPFLLKTIALVIYASEFCGSNCNTRLQSARAFS